MDSLRLLTRGSGIKSAPVTSSQQLPRSTQDVSRSDNILVSESRKRKRAEIEAPTVEVEELTRDQVRKIQKSCHIRITDLKVLYKGASDDNRKAQKEAARLYPQPLQSFAALYQKGTNHALLSNLVEQGYKEPSEVQTATISLLLPDDGQPMPNLLTVAPTGSGKTLAFMAPLIDRIAKQHKLESDTTRQVSAIVLAPTKELVSQIVNEGRKLSQRTGVRITQFRKGMLLSQPSTSENRGEDGEDSSDSQDSPDILSQGTMVKADIIVATPLTLAHALPNTDLPQIEYFVLDEADVLLDALFREQTLSVWSACTSASLHISLWSATIGSNIEELALDIIKSRQKKYKIKPSPPLLRCIIGLKDTSLPNITHKLIYAATEAGKLTGLRQIIRPPPSTNYSNQNTDTSTSIPRLTPPFLIFCQTIERATALYEEIKYDLPLPVQPTSDNSSTTQSSVSRIALLHASLTDPQRATTMQNFRLGKIWILITTDLLSRGIDFRGLNAVINYDIPTTSASYVHRAGRTGRNASTTGICVTFYTRDDVKYLRPITNIITKSTELHTRNDPSTRPADVNSSTNNGDNNTIPTWLTSSLPALSQTTKKDLKQRGVDVRRAIKESDDKAARRTKARNRVGTKSGFERREEAKRKGMVEGSRRRATREKSGEQIGDGDEDDEFGGFE